MGRFEHGPASGTARRVLESRAGLVRLNYFGYVDAAAMAVLRAQLIGVVGAANQCVIHTETALIAMDEMPAVEPVLQPVADAAIIVTPENRELFVEYAQRLAEVGITRAVFLQSQMEQAYRWAERRAELVRGL